MQSFSCGFESNVGGIKSIANKRIESAYGYGQGRLIVDYQKAAEIAKNQDKQAEAIKVANQQLQVLKAVEKNTGKEQAAILK